MKIKRKIGGVEISIELTSEELRWAYEEKQGEYDRTDILLAFEEDERYEELKSYISEELKEQILSDGSYRLRKNIDKYSMSFECARDDAISEIFKKCIRYQHVTCDSLKFRQNNLFYYCIDNGHVMRAGDSIPPEAEFIVTDKEILQEEDSKLYRELCKSYYMVGY